MERLLQDLRLALKALRRRPLYVFLVVSTLALGIGATTAIFSVVNAVLLSGLSHADSDELVMFRLNAGDVNGFPAASTGELELFQDESETLSKVSGTGASFTAYAVIDGEGVPVETALVSANMFPMLGVKPVLGRLFTEDDESVPFGQNGSTVISYEMWQRHYGGKPDVIGKSLRGEGGPNQPAPEIIGVLPQGFLLELGSLSRMDGTIDSWIANRVPPQWANRFMRVVGRLAPGVTLNEAQLEMDVMMARVIEDHPEADADGPNPRFELIPLHHDIVRDVRPAILILFAAVSLVFLVACGNAASVLLARTSMRQSELALHNAIGASRLQITRMVLTESLVLAGIAGILGAGLAYLGIKGLLLIDPGTIPMVAGVGLDPTVLFFAVGLSMVATLLFGLLPSVQASSPAHMNESLRQGGRSGGAISKRARQTLVVFQVAFSIVLLTATGLLVRTFVNLQSTDLGYQAENVVTFRARIDGARFPFNQLETRFNVYRQLTQRLEKIPGVVAAGSVSLLPLDGQNLLLSFKADGQVSEQNADFRHVLPGYFETMRIPLQAGRDLTDGDNIGPQPVLLVDEMLAERTWPGEDPLGKWVEWSLNNRQRRAQVVGVVGHSRILAVDDPGRPQIYLPYTDVGFGNFSMVVRTERQMADILPALRLAAEEVGTGRVIDVVRPMEDYVAASMDSYRFALLLMSALGVVAIVLTVVGVYGTVSYLVALRTREMGIRVALGAQSGEVVMLNLKEGMVLTALGVVTGAVAMLGVGRFMGAILYDVAPTDPSTFATVGLAVVGLGMLASFVPARRASNIDPLQALREE
jgi:putative ABC transport system permease protein